MCTLPDPAPDAGPSDPSGGDTFATAFRASKAAYRDWVLANYPALWDRATDAYRRADGRDGGRVWLLEAASYLFRTAGVCWAVDPAYSAHFVPTPPDAAADIPDLDLMLLTHQHADHVDRTLIRQFAAREGLILAVPDSMVDLLREELRGARCVVEVVRSGDCVNVGALSATAFASMHFERAADGSGQTGVPELGWLVEVQGQRILLPGDVRTYAPDVLPDFGPVDWGFAHVWLGRGRSLTFDEADLDRYCRYVVGLNAAHVCLAHLLEISRDEHNYWSFAHAGLVAGRLLALSPLTEVTIARAGQQVELW